MSNSHHTQTDRLSRVITAVKSQSREFSSVQHYRDRPLECEGSPSCSRPALLYRIGSYDIVACSSHAASFGISRATS